MKLENIYVDNIYTYKSLCEKLEEPYKNHCSKDAQLVTWSRYFAWEKQGIKYLITKIYESPLPPPPPLSRKKLSKYTKLLYPIIIHKLYTNFVETKHTVFRESKLSFYRSVGFASRIIDVKPKSDYWLDNAIFQEVKSNFFEVASRVFKRTIENLNKTEKIKCQEVHYIFHLLKKNERETIKKEENPVLATAEEEALIAEYFAEIKSELQQQKQLYLLFYNDEKSEEDTVDLYNELNAKLSKHGIYCKFTIWQFSLFDKNEDITILYNECFADKTIEQCKKEMNNAILDLMQKKTIREARLSTHKPNLIEDRKWEISEEIFATIDCHADNGLLSTERYIEEYTKKRKTVINDFIKLQ